MTNTTVMEPVKRIQSIQKERWELLCCLCKQRCGAKVQCESCYTAYHPLCGRIAGLQLDTTDRPDGTPRLTTYCARHCTPHPQLSGVFTRLLYILDRRLCSKAVTLEISGV